MKYSSYKKPENQFDKVLIISRNACVSSRIYTIDRRLKILMTLRISKLYELTRFFTQIICILNLENFGIFNQEYIHYKISRIRMAINLVDDLLIFFVLETFIGCKLWSKIRRKFHRKLFYYYQHRQPKEGLKDAHLISLQLSIESYISIFIIKSKILTLLWVDALPK